MKGNLSANPASHEARNPHLFEADIFSRIREVGNEAAWAEFFEWAKSEIFRIALKKGLSAAEADDLFQDVMLVIVSEVTTPDRSDKHTNMAAWMRSIASFKANDIFR